MSQKRPKLWSSYSTQIIPPPRSHRPFEPFLVDPLPVCVCFTLSESSLIQLNPGAQNVCRPWRELHRQYKSELRSTKCDWWLLLLLITVIYFPLLEGLCSSDPCSFEFSIFFGVLRPRQKRTKEEEKRRRTREWIGMNGSFMPPRIMKILGEGSPLARVLISIWTTGNGCGDAKIFRRGQFTSIALGKLNLFSVSVEY